MQISRIAETTLKKWKICKNPNCRINSVSTDWRSLVDCNVCDYFWIPGMARRKKFSEWLQELVENKKIANNLIEQLSKKQK